MSKRLFTITFLLHVFLGSVASTKDPNKNGELVFVENKNQWETNVKYQSELLGGSLSLSTNSFHFLLHDKEKLIQLHENTHNIAFYEHGENVCYEAQQIQKHYYKVDFINGNADVALHGNKKTNQYYNYFIGNDSSKWASKANGYRLVKYKNLYDNIDLLVYSAGTNPKYDFVVEPGGNPSAIQLKYDGIDDIYLFNEQLYIETSLGLIVETAPLVYQVVNGKHMQVKSKYVLNCDVLSFEFPEGYDCTQPLIIDPLLIFSTFSGSTADNWGNAATPGEKGNLFSAGVTNHDNAGGTFPATTGAFQTTWGGDYDATIIKFDSTGTQMLFATYLGGNQAETPHSVIMNDDGELIVFGSTSSTNFPTTTNAYDRSFNGGDATTLTVNYINGSDIFIAKISNDGSELLASTYLGGSRNDGINDTFSTLTKNYGDQLRGDVITDSDNSIYIASTSSSENLPIVSGFQNSLASSRENDAILFKLDTDLTTVLWSSYLGGTGEDAALSMQLDMDNNVFLAGGTTSSNFPATSDSYEENYNGAIDGWVAHVDLEGDSIKQASYTGTSQYDQVYFIDLDDSEEVYLYGQTRGEFPRTAGVYSNSYGRMFVQKLSNDLSTLRFSTAFGSNSNSNVNISPTAFLVNDCSNLYMTGWGGQTNGGIGNGNTFNMPVSNDAWQTTTSGSDFYLMVLTDDATEFLYGTYLGGDQSRTHVDGGTSRFDKQGVVYHSVCAGCAANNATGGPTSDFPTTEGAWSNTNNSGNCNNAAFKFDLASLRARIRTNSLTFNEPDITTLCLPGGFAFENKSIGGETFVWDFSDGNSQQMTDTTHTVHYYTNPGRYKVSLTAIDENTCIGVDVTSVYVNVYEGSFVVKEDETICGGDITRLEAYGGTSYFWFDQDTTFYSYEQFVDVRPDESATYYVYIEEGVKGCTHLDTVNITVIPEVIADFSVGINYNCFDVPEIVIINKSQNVEHYNWNFGDNEISVEAQPIHKYDSGIYQITLRTNTEFCYDEKTEVINTNPIKVYNMITPESSPGKNDKFIIQSPFPIRLVIVDRWGKEVLDESNYQNDWNADGEVPGVYFYSIFVDGEEQCKGWVQVFK